MTTFDTKFLADIEIDPISKGARNIADIMSEAVEDRINDWAYQIALDYCPPPADEADEDAYNEQVIMPIYEKILDAALENLTRKD